MQLCVFSVFDGTSVFATVYGIFTFGNGTSVSLSNNVYSVGINALGATAYTRKTVKNTTYSFKFRITECAGDWVGFSFDRSANTTLNNSNGLTMLLYKGYTADIRKVTANWNNGTQLHMRGVDPQWTDAQNSAINWGSQWHTF